MGAAAGTCVSQNLRNAAHRHALRQLAAEHLHALPCLAAFAARPWPERQRALQVEPQVCEAPGHRRRPARILQLVPAGARWWTGA